MLANQYVGDNKMIPACLSAQHYNDTAGLLRNVLLSGTKNKEVPHPIRIRSSDGRPFSISPNLPLPPPSQHFAATCFTLSNGRASSVLQQHGVSDLAVIFRNGNIIIIMLCHAP